MFKRTCIFLYIIISGFRVIMAKEINRPNIVIIMADDMGVDDVSFRGSKLFLTPNIDALAYHGKVLDRLYTPPVCTPSRAALLTGQYPIHTGTQHLVPSNEDPWGILENFTTMAEIFQAHGYSTNLIGKWHLGFGRKEYTPTYKGFDQHYGYWGSLIDYYRRRSKMLSNFSMGYDFRHNMDVECAPEGSYVTDLFTQKAESIILNKRSEQPLFLMVNHLAAHAASEDEPLQAPQEEIEKFSFIPDKSKRIFAAVVSKLDESVGRIVWALDKSNLLQNTIILFYSDNGAATRGLFNNTGSNWPLRGQKHSPWEGALRVPGALWSPLMKNKASVYQPPIYVGDFLPTLAAAANICLNSYQLKLDGLSHWPDLVQSTSVTDSTKHSNREILHMLDDIFEVKSLMFNQFKYINGTTNNGELDHVVSSRAKDVTDPRDIKYVEVIQNSLVSKALAKYDEDPLTWVKIKNLRSQAEIKCGDLETPCKPLEEECLFNIWLDPCEKNNLARNPLYKETLKEMRKRLEKLTRTAIKPRYGGGLWEYDPARHNCCWTNFLDEPPTEYTLSCDYNSPPCQS